MLTSIGFMVGFDGADHPILLQLVNCDCLGTMSHPVPIEKVRMAATWAPGQIGETARTALLDLELHLRDDGGDS